MNKEQSIFAGKIDNWQIAKAALTQAKVTEMTLRLDICNEMFDGETGHFKTETNISSDEKAIAKSKTTLVLDEEKLTELFEADKLTVAAIDCFSPGKVKVSEKLRNIPRTNKVWEAITEKPATPTLEIK